MTNRTASRIGVVLAHIALLIPLTPSTAAQSADKILKQSVRAITKGAGEKALRRVTSWQATGTIVRARDGAAGRFQTSAAQPNLYTFNWEIGGFETSAGFTGKSSWRRDSRDGLRTLTGKASDDLLAEAWHRNRRWLDYKSETYQFTYYRRHRIRRLITKNGQPLSPGDQAKEDHRIEKLIRDLDEGKPVRIPYNQRRLKIGDLLRVSRFINPRRERFRQRDVVVTDFEPNPNFKPENLDDAFVHNLAGSMWIDTADLQIARVEFQLVDAFKVGGGAFFMMKPGSRFVTEQDRFNNEIWLPAYTEVTISARAMIFANFGVIQKVTYGDYRRFDVSSEEKLKAPVAERKP